MALRNFDNAKFYSCIEPETLTHEDPESAIIEMIEREMTKDETYDQVAERICPIEVTGYVSKEVEDSFFEACAESAVESARESWWEEYGSPDGDDDPLTDEREKWLLAVLTANIKKGFRLAEPWQCEQVGSKLYSLEEVKALVRD